MAVKVLGGPPSVRLYGEAVPEADGWSVGQEVKVKGERGLFRVTELVRLDGRLAWATVYGGPTGYGSFRSFAPARLKRIRGGRR